MMLWPVIFVPLVLGSAVGFFGQTSDRTWYADLKKSSGTPPGWVFGPVWSALYLLMGVVLYRILKMKNNGLLLSLFALQLALNLAWSPIFFAKKDPRLALHVIVALVAALVATIVALYAAGDAVSAALLLPYLAWVLYATRLNAGIVTENNF